MGSVGPSQGEDNPPEKERGTCKSPRYKSHLTISSAVEFAGHPSTLAGEVQPAGSLMQETPLEGQTSKEEKSSSSPLIPASKKKKSRKNPFSIVSSLFKCCVHPSVHQEEHLPASITRQKEREPIEIENSTANPLTETVIVPASQTTVVTGKSHLPVDHPLDEHLPEKSTADGPKEAASPVDYTPTEGDLDTEKDIENTYGAMIGSPLLVPTTKGTDLMMQGSSPQGWLLKPLEPAYQGKKCLVLDLDETLVHSSFKLIHQADFVVPVEIEGQYHNVYVIKRPGVDVFLKKMGELYEVVVFTASLSKYADPVLDMLDVGKIVSHRLFRESCYNHHGNYVKDLSQLGRDLREVIIIDNSPASYVFHPANAVPISSWFNDPHDTELLDIIPFLEDLTKVNDVSAVLDMLI